MWRWSKQVLIWEAVDLIGTWLTDWRNTQWQVVVLDLGSTEMHPGAEKQRNFKTSERLSLMSKEDHILGLRLQSRNYSRAVTLK